MEMNEKQYEQACVLIYKTRQLGASIRSIAQMWGMSKSTLHRWWPAIEATALESMVVPNGTSSGNGSAPSGDSPDSAQNAESDDITNMAAQRVGIRTGATPDLPPTQMGPLLFGCLLRLRLTRVMELSHVGQTEAAER